MVRCSECKYCIPGNSLYDGITNICEITRRINPQNCFAGDEIEIEDIKYMQICFNCAHWLGGGDLGLTCTENYFAAYTDGSLMACSKFERINN